MDFSTPDQFISHAWDPETIAPETLSASAAMGSSMQHEKCRIDGTHAKRVKLTDMETERYFHGHDPGAAQRSGGVAEKLAAEEIARQGLLTLLCHNSELAVEIGKYLNPDDIVSLYSMSRAFHEAINKYMLASVRAWIAHKAPEAGKVFDFRFYKRNLVADPAGRTWGYQYDTATAAARSSGGDGVGSGQAIGADKAEEVRAIPGLKYLQLVVGRDRYCREIRAILARHGHRTPASMHSTLLKLWLCLDIPTGPRRAALLRNRDVWADQDLYNAQLLFVKLGMHFNDPVYGPNTYELLHLMMGQRGLYPLWQLLARKRFTRLAEVLALKVRYDFPVAPSPSDPRVRGAYHWSAEYFGSSIHGVPYAEIGRGHLECWGLGPGCSASGLRHLPRPDELVPIEAVARGLELDAHLMGMMMWGYVDWTTGENLVPSAEELHVDDEAALLGAADTSHHWRPRHALKKRFHELSPAQQQRILDEDEDERLRSMAWCGETDDYSSASEDGSHDGDDEEDDTMPCSLEDEMTRGYVVPPPPLRTGSGSDDVVVVPGLDDQTAWVDFVNDVVMSGLPPDVSGEAALRAEAWQSYQDVEMDSEWDWGLWLRQQQQAEGGSERDETEDFDSYSEAETEIADGNMH
ncbi:hypothetical protein V2A60_010029 [Cordyceps javanica]|uniref:Histidine kinase group protein n=1 Tax=Cordyceps javanica TaxID=43265 RepID=A0A545VTN3_9HYPO|nr:histidine kinase group protein [Cordyceps javanica]TQW05088.1 hypothetical protein IF2G_07025 [Cordyceps javanica]